MSTPLDRDEVRPGLDLRDFTIANIPERVEKLGDLFHGVLERTSFPLKKIEAALENLSADQGD